MAALWCDGFDHYGPTGNESKMLDGAWASAGGVVLVETPVNTVQSAPGVTSRSIAINANSAVRRSLGGEFATVGLMSPIFMSNLPIVGPQAAAWVLQAFRNIENRAQINIKVGTTGRVEIWGGGNDGNLGPNGTFLARSTKEMAAGTFNHIETKVHMSATVGTVEVRVNGEVFVTYAGNTARALGGSLNIAQVYMGLGDSTTPPSFNGNWYTDDWAAWNDEATDAQGHASTVTDFIGQYGVYTLSAVADATPEDWELSTGVNSFELVNEIPPNENTDFIFASTTALKTALEVAPLPVNITDVAFVAPIIRSRKTDNGNCAVTIGVISGGTEEENDGGEDAQTPTFSYYTHPWEQDPDTTDKWNPLNMPLIQVDRST